MTTIIDILKNKFRESLTISEFVNDLDNSNDTEIFNTFANFAGSPNTLNIFSNNSDSFKENIVASFSGINNEPGIDPNNAHHKFSIHFFNFMNEWYNDSDASMVIETADNILKATRGLCEMPDKIYLKDISDEEDCVANIEITALNTDTPVMTVTGINKSTNDVNIIALFIEAMIQTVKLSYVHTYLERTRL